jgi:predicted DNA-binding protein
MKKTYNYQRLDKPLSFRVPLKVHNKYKSLSGFGRKTIQYKFNLWIEKQIKKQEVE